MKTVKHLHILIRATIQKPKALNVEELKEWTRQVVTNQNLEPIAGPYVTDIQDEGNEGPTGGVHIKTSHMAFHIWDNKNLIQADLYTCGDLDVDKFLDEFKVFEPTHLEYMVLDRDNGFKILEVKQVEVEILRILRPRGLADELAVW